MMGLPIEQLVVATNENDVLDEFFKTGRYQVRTSKETHETSSPSMDISKASNFERFIFDLLKRDGALTRKLFHDELNRVGYFDVRGHVAFETVQATFGFVSGKSTHQNRLESIRQTQKQFDQIIDPHTADGLKVAREHLRVGTPMVVLETALPIKFASTIVEALGHDPSRPKAFEDIEALPKKVVDMGVDVQAIKDFMIKHCA
jgi:threonine synthase